MKTNSGKVRSKSPWGLAPFCPTERARKRWDWSGAGKRRALVNAARVAAGLPAVGGKP